MLQHRTFLKSELTSMLNKDRTDFLNHPTNNDSFIMSEIWGFNFAVISGAGQFQVDEINLTAP
jgi:hypothetical protein